MKRRSLFVMLGVAVAQVFSSSAFARSLDEIRKSGSIEFVTTSASPPHGFLDPRTGTLAGIMIDVGNAVAKHLEVKAKFTEVPFSGLIPTLTSGRADAMSASLFITEERAQVVDFSTPVYGWGEGIIINQNSKHRYTKLEDLKDRKVGTLTDSVQYKMVKSLPGTTVVTYADYVTLITDVRAGRVDLGIVDPPTVMYQIQRNSIPGVVLDHGYKPSKDWAVGLTIQKGNSSLLAAVNSALSTMKQNGELEAILAKWNVKNLMTK